jgi:ABC-2 type transport system ATP-binding protein/lipopolysaccharide transport system ATP-binding protein
VHEVPEGGRYGDHQVCEITEAWFEQDGVRVSEAAQGDRLGMAFRVRFHARIEEPVFGFSLRNDVGHTIFITTTEWQTTPTGTFDVGDEATVRIEVENVLAPTKYELTPSVARAGLGADALDLREDLAAVYVHGTMISGGLVDLPHDFVLERG